LWVTDLHNDQIGNVDSVIFLEKGAYFIDSGEFVGDVLVVGAGEEQFRLDVAFDDFGGQVEVEEVGFEAFEDLRFLEYITQLYKFQLLLILLKLPIILTELPQYRRIQCLSLPPSLHFDLYLLLEGVQFLYEFLLGEGFLVGGDGFFAGFGQLGVGAGGGG